MVLALALNGCKPSPQDATQTPPPAVSVITVTEQAVGSYEEYVARTDAVNTVNLRARVEGTLTIQDTTGNFEGRRVKKGQLLFEVDPKPYIAALKKAEAGEKIIVEGLQKVREGIEVTPVAVGIDQESGAIVMKASADQKSRPRKSEAQRKEA